MMSRRRRKSPSTGRRWSKQAGLRQYWTRLKSHMAISFAENCTRIDAYAWVYFLTRPGIGNAI